MAHLLKHEHPWGARVKHTPLEWFALDDTFIQRPDVDPDTGLPNPPNPRPFETPPALEGTGVSFTVDPVAMHSGSVWYLIRRTLKDGRPPLFERFIDPIWFDDMGYMPNTYFDLKAPILGTLVEAWTP